MRWNIHLKKIILVICCLLSLITITSISASNAGLNVVVIGKEGQTYKIGLAFKYDETKEKQKVNVENKITNYKDSEGYEFYTSYSEFTTIDTISFEYDFSEKIKFKIIILTESDILLSTKELSCEDFNTTYFINLKDIDLTNYSKTEVNIIENSYIELENNYQARILKLIFRLVIIFIIIYLLTMFFGYHKFNFWHIFEITFGILFLILNIITTLNIKKLGLDTASDILIGISLGVLVLETLLYLFMFKKNQFKQEPSKIRMIVYLVIISVLPLVINILLLGVLG